MARRRRFRRNRRRAHHQQQPRNSQKEDAPINNSVMNTPVTRNVRGIQNLDTQKHFENPRNVLTPIQNFDSQKYTTENIRAVLTPIQNFDGQKICEKAVLTPIQNFDGQKNCEKAVLTPIQNFDSQKNFDLSETPRMLRSNSVVLRKNTNSEMQSMRSRSNSFVTPKNSSVYNNINCTNLNLLFDENKAAKKSNSNLLFEEKHNLKRSKSNHFYEELKLNSNYFPDEFKLHSNLLTEELKKNPNLLIEELKFNSNCIPGQLKLNSNLVPEELRLNSNLLSEELRLNSNLLPKELTVNPNLFSEEFNMNSTLLSEGLKANLRSRQHKSHTNSIPSEFHSNSNHFSDEHRINSKPDSNLHLQKNRLKHPNNASQTPSIGKVQNNPQTSPFIETTQTTPITRNVQNDPQISSNNRRLQNDPQPPPISRNIKNAPQRSVDDPQTSPITRHVRNNSQIPRKNPRTSPISRNTRSNPHIHKTNPLILQKSQITRNTNLPASPIMIDVGTQTGFFNSSGNKNCMLENTLNQTKYDIHTFAQIFETPKIPYNFSPSEYTVFAPQYVDSSTPVNGCNKESNLLAGLAKNYLHNKRMEAMKQSFYYDCTPNPRPVSTILDKNKMYSINKHRFYKSMSPKIYRNTCLKLYNKHQSSRVANRTTNEIPKSFSPIKRSALHRSDNFLNVSSASTYTKVMARVRSFHRKHSSKWLGKLFEICSWFGMTIKTGLAAIYKPKTTELFITAEITNDPQEAICACKNIYESKIEQLEEQIRDMRTSCNKEVEAVKKEMVNLRTELMEIMDKKIAEIKRTTAQCAPPPPPPMMPPPPPPPPPMPLNMSTPLSRNAKLTKVKREGKKDESTRPVISLDDILKVRLRKAGDRQQIATPKVQRRNTQPFISGDMLKQVKLRPASKSHITASFVEQTKVSTSPASSLTRILRKCTGSSVSGDSSDQHPAIDNASNTPYYRKSL